MVNVFALLKPILILTLKIVGGVRPQRVEIETGTVVNFWVPVTRKSSKPSVVLIHGFFADGILTWLFQVLSLSSKCNVYVPDLLFFGDSVTDNLDRSTSFQAECIAEGLKKLGVESCSVVGLSYGGMVGFKLAKMYPSLVETFVASGTVMELTESISRASLHNLGSSGWTETLLPETIDGLKSLIEISFHSKIMTWFPDFVYKHFLEVMFSNGKERAELLNALVVPDNQLLLPADYSQNITLLWGEDDRIFNLKVADQLKRQLGDKATLRCIAKAGHAAPLDRPIMYNQHLRTILVIE